MTPTANEARLLKGFILHYHERNIPKVKQRFTPCSVKRGLTLLEALIASIILAGMVIATASALSSTQQNGQFAEDQVQGALAANAKMEEILADDYANYLSYNGQDESPGNMLTAQGINYPGTFYRIGRRISVRQTQKKPPGLGGLVIDGLEISVTAYDLTGYDTFTVTRFVPAP